MRVTISIIFLFSFLACTSTRNTEPDKFDYSFIMVDTTMHVDIDSSFDKLPISTDSIFSDSTIYKYATIDTIDSNLKNQLFKLGVVNFLSNKIDTFPDWQLFFHSLKIYKLAKINLFNNIRSYLLLDKQGNLNQQILLLNVDSNDSLVSICLLGGRSGLNTRIMTKFIGHTKMKMTTIFYDSSENSSKIEIIDFEINSFGKWKKIKYESKEKSGRHYM